MRTIWSLWQDALAEHRSNPAYLVEEGGRWREVSQEEAATAVTELAHGLLELGVGKGDAFGILARTRLEWVLLDFALAQIGAVAAPIYPSSTASEACYILEHANVVGCLVEDDDQLAKIEAARPEHVYTLETLDELRALDAEGIKLEGLELHAPSLDDVFLAKTGRSLEGAAEEEEEEAEVS